MGYGRLIYLAVVIGLIVLAYKFNPQFFRGFMGKHKGNTSKNEIASDENLEANIWKLDDEDLSEALFLYLDGVDRESLNEVQKTVLCMSKLEMEVNNGGFDQFFFNTNNEWDDILVASAKRIGAFDVARICEKAIEIIKSDLDEDTITQRLNDECDKVFYEDSQDYISRLCGQYARQHREAFDL